MFLKMINESVLITGSNGGLGREISMSFAKAGYDLVLHGRDLNKIDSVFRNNTLYGAHITKVIGDLREEKTLDRLYNVAKKSKLSVLINNAGVPCPGISLEKITDEQIDEILEVNTLSLIKLTKRIYSLFLEKGRGTVININSMVGLEPRKFRSIYSASKFGERGFTESLRLEAKERGIRVIGVYPTRIMTKPDSGQGFTPGYVAKEIFNAFNSKMDDLILDGRPH